MKKGIIAFVIIAACIAAGVYFFYPQIQHYSGRYFTKHVLVHPQVQSSINENVSKYIISHPQVIEQSIINLQAIKAHEEDMKNQKLVRDYSSDLLNDKDGSPVLGNPNGSIKMVVFMDPFCGYCRRFHQTLNEAILKNKDLEVIIREIPFISDKSEMVIRAMLAAKLQGKYPEIQQAIYKIDPSVTQNEILKLAKEAKIDSQKLQQDMQLPEIKNLIQRNVQLAKQIHLSGTPTFILHGQIIAGALSSPQLEKLIKKETSTGPIGSNS